MNLKAEVQTSVADAEEQTTQEELTADAQEKTPAVEEKSLHKKGLLKKQNVHNKSRIRQ